MITTSLSHLPLDAQERIQRHIAVTPQWNDAVRQMGVAHIIWTPINRLPDSECTTDIYRKEGNSQ